MVQIFLDNGLKLTFFVVVAFVIILSVSLSSKILYQMQLTNNLFLIAFDAKPINSLWCHAYLMFTLSFWGFFLMQFFINLSTPFWSSIQSSIYSWFLKPLFVLHSRFQSQKIVSGSLFLTKKKFFQKSFLFFNFF